MVTVRTICGEFAAGRHVEELIRGYVVVNIQGELFIDRSLRGMVSGDRK